MSAQRFSIGQQFRWRGTLYEVKRQLPQDELNIENVASGALQVVTLQALVTALFAGELYFIVRATKPTRPGKIELSQQQALSVELSDYPSALVEIARRRLWIIEPLLSAKAVCTLDAIKNRVAEVKAWEASHPTNGPGLAGALSWRSVYRWLRDYQASGGDVRALIPSTALQGGRGHSRLSPEVGALIDSLIREQYYRPERTSVKDLVYLIAAAIDDENQRRPASERLRQPATATIYRRLETFDRQERFAVKHGQRAAKRQFTQCGVTAYPERPLERVEIDHTPIDVIVVDDRDFLPLGRPTLTKAIDVATRYPLGYYLGFEPPSYYTVMECLHHAIWLKADSHERFGTEHCWQAYGIPSLLVVDNGKEFIGQDLTDACLQLGITLENAPVRTPEFKATIERHFGTCNALFHTLPGTTFSNLFQRQDYASAQHACITVDELEKTLHLFLIDLYAERFHTGLNGIPARQWETALQQGYSPRLPASAQELAILLGRVTQRVLHRYGIEFENLQYNCRELATLRIRLNGKAAKIKFHPGDLSKLYVYDPFEQSYLTVPALAEEYAAQLSLWKHRIISAAVRREQATVDLAALGRAKRKIQDVVDAALDRKRRQGGRKLARWQDSGQPPSLSQEPSPATTVEHPPSALPAAGLSDEVLQVDAPKTSHDEWSITYPGAPILNQPLRPGEKGV
jgi:putative transposase